MAEEYSKDTMENLRIHELRDLARKLGVQAPTLLKKEELIEQAMAIISGEKKPYVKKSNKGRPVKGGADMSSIFIPSFREEGDNFDLSSENQRFSFLINSPGIEFNIDYGAEECQGFLDIHPNGYGILRVKDYESSEKDIFVCSQMIKDYDLRAGIRIKGLEKEVQIDKPHAIIKLLEIEGLDVKRYKMQERFENIPYGDLKDEIVVQKDNASFRVLEGSRNLILFSNPADMFEMGCKISKEIADVGRYRVYFLNINALPEDMVKSFDYEKVDIPFSMSEVNQINVVNLVVERAKRKVESGENVVVILKGMSKFLRLLSTAVTNTVSYEDLNIKALYKLKKLITSAKETKCGSLTILMLDSPNGCPQRIQDVTNFELVPLFNSVINL